MQRSELIAIRDVNFEQDSNYIFSTFLRGLYYGKFFYIEIQKDSFMKNYQRVIDSLIRSPGITIKVACLKDTPDVILGYSISKGNVLHYVFVRPQWRSIGIATLLTPKEITCVTHLTKVGLSIIRNKNWIFDPFSM